MGNLLLAYNLLWLQEAMSLQRRSLAPLLWINLFIVVSFSNIVEGYFLTDVFDSTYTFIGGGAVIIVFTGLQAIYASYVLPEGDKRVIDRLSSHLKMRSGVSWAKRILAGTLGYFPISVFFGMLVSPFVMPYYRDPSLGLVVPFFTVIVPREVLRGFMYMAYMLPIAAALGSERRATVIALTGMLFIPGAAAAAGRPGTARSDNTVPPCGDPRELDCLRLHPSAAPHAPLRGGWITLE